MLFPLSHLWPLPLRIFLPLLLRRFLNPGGKALMKTFHLGLSAPNVFHSACCPVWVSVLILICNRQTFLWYRLNEALIYVYRSDRNHCYIPLAAWVLAFSLVLYISSLRFLVTSAVSGMGSISWGGMQSIQKVVDYFSNIVPLLPVYFLGRSLL